VSSGTVIREVSDVTRTGVNLSRAETVRHAIPQCSRMDQLEKGGVFEKGENCHIGPMDSWSESCGEATV